MAKLVECVPNFSEGRRVEVVDRLAAAIVRTPGALLLDRTSDASHNRSVLTLAGEPEAVTRAMELAVEVAVGEIDMERQTGEHPRIGAVDVIPFVPLGDSTLDECIELARAFGARIAARFELPVYLYAAAATRSDRVKLADVRRGQYEGLKVEIANQGREPDFGPTRTHPSAGAVAVGARPFLIAYNINLASTDIELARRISRRVRESELIGLCPLAAFLAVADHAGFAADAPVEERCAAATGYLRLRDFSPMQVLELRLDAAQRGEG